MLCLEDSLGSARPSHLRPVGLWSFLPGACGRRPPKLRCPRAPQTEYARYENGHYSYRIHRSPLCEYMINFIHKLKHLPEKYMMNSVLENFTILQVCVRRGGGESGRWAGKVACCLPPPLTPAGGHQQRHAGDAAVRRVRLRGVGQRARDSAPHLPAGEGIRDRGAGRGARHRVRRDVGWGPAGAAPTKRQES